MFRPTNVHSCIGTTAILANLRVLWCRYRHACNKGNLPFCGVQWPTVMCHNSMKSEVLNPILSGNVVHSSTTFWCSMSENGLRNRKLWPKLLTLFSKFIQIEGTAATRCNDFDGLVWWQNIEYRSKLTGYSCSELTKTTSISHRLLSELIFSEIWLLENRKKTTKLSKYWGRLCIHRVVWLRRNANRSKPIAYSCSQPT